MDREQAIQTMAKPIASRLRSILVLRGMTSWSWENEDREVDAHARGAAKDIYDAGYRLPQEQAAPGNREGLEDIIREVWWNGHGLSSGEIINLTEYFKNKADQILSLIEHELKWADENYQAFHEGQSTSKEVKKWARGY
uniref:Uncharacterized protein n=1 Tax=viral metagenome TaxID=1070528 RepID=A0A6H2A576_9ZZZZ